MLVSICGMPRSGSTFSFNIAREILENRGTVHFEATELTEQAINASNAQHIIIKNYRLDQRFVTS